MDVTVRTVFEAPRSLVAAVAGDPSQAPRWYSTVRWVRWHDDPVVRVGARVDLVTRFLGRDVPYTYRIEELVPDERLVMRAEQGPVRLVTAFTWWDEDPHDGRPCTGMSLRNVGRPHGMTTLASGAVTLGMKRAMHRDLERLRIVLRDELAGW